MPKQTRPAKQSAARRVAAHRDTVRAAKLAVDAELAQLEGDATAAATAAAPPPGPGAEPPATKVRRRRRATELRAYRGVLKAVNESAKAVTDSRKRGLKYDLVPRIVMQRIVRETLGNLQKPAIRFKREAVTALLEAAEHEARLHWAPRAAVAGALGRVTVTPRVCEVTNAALDALRNPGIVGVWEPKAPTKRKPRRKTEQ